MKVEKVWDIHINQECVLETKNFHSGRCWQWRRHYLLQVDNKVYLVSLNFFERIVKTFCCCFNYFQYQLRSLKPPKVLSGSEGIDLTKIKKIVPAQVQGIVGKPKKEVVDQAWFDKIDEEDVLRDKNISNGFVRNLRTYNKFQEQVPVELIKTWPQTKIIEVIFKDSPDDIERSITQVLDNAQKLAEYFFMEMCSSLSGLANSGNLNRAEREDSIIIENKYILPSLYYLLLTGHLTYVTIQQHYYGNFSFSANTDTTKFGIDPNTCITTSIDWFIQKNLELKAQGKSEILIVKREEILSLVQS